MKQHSIVSANDSAIVTSEEPKDQSQAYEQSNRTNVPLFMLVHPENTLPRKSAHGIKVYDFMTSVNKFGIIDNSRVFLSSEASSNLFPMNKTLFTTNFVHVKVNVTSSDLPDNMGQVYTLYTDSDYDVARFVKWAYEGTYPQDLNLESAIRVQMPTSRYSDPNEYLPQPDPSCNSPAISTINMAVNEKLTVPCQREAIAYDRDQELLVINNFPFLVHLRMYVFARKYGLGLLENEALGQAVRCFPPYEINKTKLRMKKRDRVLLNAEIRYLKTCLGSDDPMRNYADEVLRYNRR